MQRWLSTLFIGGYLAAMGAGILGHTLKVGTTSHPTFYFFVWDMFCGWSSHEIRYHLIAEGESGQYYDAAPGPWGGFKPFSDLPRHHYDALGNSLYRMADNTLRHTDHEPIRRILVIEETWNKKYNLPDALWRMRFDEPKVPHSYFWHSAEYSPDGQLTIGNGNFLTHEAQRMISDNPRLIADSQRRRPILAIAPEMRFSANSQTPQNPVASR